MESAGEPKSKAAVRARWKNRRYLLGPLPLLLLLPAVAAIMAPTMYLGFKDVRVFERERAARVALEALASVESQVQHTGLSGAPPGTYVADLGALEAAYPELRRRTNAARSAGYNLKIDSATTTGWQASATIRRSARASDFLVDESGEVRAAF
jgi:hypothetical protein